MLKATRVDTFELREANLAEKNLNMLQIAKGILHQ